MRYLLLKRILSRLLLVSLLTTALLNLSGCGHVAIHDHTFWGDEGSEGADGVDFFTGATTHLAKPQWDDTRFGMICEDDATYLDWKSIIEKLCSEEQVCDQDMQAQVTDFFKAMDAVRAQRLP